MALTAAQMKAREGRLTASAVSPLMTGDADRLLKLWREIVGDPDYIRDDLSGIWPVALGNVTEELNLDWYQRKHGNVSRRGEVVVHPRFSWAAATLDGWDDQRACPIECKHVGGREPLAKVLARYQPQFQFQMIVTETRVVMASIIEAANEPLVEPIAFDPVYANELWTRAVAFMRDYVDTLTPPSAFAPVAAPAPAVKTYDMQGNNQWASESVTWLDSYRAAKQAASAEKALKQLVPADAQRAHGYGVDITRNRAGSLALRALKEAA